VVDQRSFNLMPILEGVYDIGNVLAVCRSTEALGKAVQVEPMKSKLKAPGTERLKL
jgi:hypothetical protein